MEYEGDGMEQAEKRKISYKTLLDEQPRYGKILPQLEKQESMRYTD